MQRLQAAPLAPQRLERRRVLDAGAASLLLGAPIPPSDYVQTSAQVGAQAGGNVSAGDTATGDTAAGDTATLGAPTLSSTPSAVSSELLVRPLQFSIVENEEAEFFLIFVNNENSTTRTFDVDWGDGSALERFERGDKPSVLVSHQYLDDDPTGTSQDAYQLRVLTTGGRQFGASETVVVKNVQPHLTVAGDLTINEGELLDLTGGALGQFSDVGTQDTHTATVNWGDGTATESVTVNQGHGSGTLSASHLYVDNDADNLYTITVTLSDDDGGTVSQEIVARVLNVNPTLDPITATDVNTKGETTLTLEFADPGTELLTVWVDWGDQLHLPPAQRFVPEAVVQGPGTQNLTLQHVYSGPPDPLHPAADILISTFIRDDDFGIPGVVHPGESETHSVAISNPGLGVTPIVIDTTPQVPRLVFPHQEESLFFTNGSSSDEGGVQTSDLRTAVGDTKSTTDRFLELRVIDPASGEESEGYRLKPEVLSNLPALFQTLPDNRYAIYLVRTETNTRRLVIEVYVRNGKLIDPGDDSEGTRDRPPTDEVTQGPQREPQWAPPQEPKQGPKQELVPKRQPDSPSEVNPLELSLPGPALLRPAQPDAPDTPEVESSLGDSARSIPPRTQILLSSAVAGLAASRAGRSWAERVDHAVAAADTKKWKQLRRRLSAKRKKG